MSPPHVDHAGFAELEVGQTRLRMERDELVGAGDEHDATRLPVLPELDAPLGEAAVGWRAPLVGSGIVDPQFLAGHRVDRTDQVERRNCVECAIDEERRSFHVAVECLGFDVFVGRGVCPGNLELADVRRVDLVGRRVLRARAVGCIVSPLDRVLRLGAGGDGSRKKDEDQGPERHSFRGSGRAGRCRRSSAACVHVRDSSDECRVEAGRLPAPDGRLGGVVISGP